MNEFISALGHAAKVGLTEGAREGINNRLDNEFFDGYNKAANICMDAISEKMDKLHNQINEGKYLSKEEQYLMAQLEKLKREIDDKLRQL